MATVCYDGYDMVGDDTPLEELMREWDESSADDLPAPTRAEVDTLARKVAADRGCPCEGAGNCGCWNAALTELEKRR